MLLDWVPLLVLLSPMLLTLRLLYKTWRLLLKLPRLECNADRTKTQTDSTNATRYVTFVGDDNASATSSLSSPMLASRITHQRTP